MGKTTFDKNLQLYQEDEGVDADLQKMQLLMKGNTELTNQLAAQIYYQIQMEDIQFESMMGIDFLDRIVDALSEKQIHQIRNQIALQKRKASNRRKVSKANKGIVVFIFATVFLICFVYLNWNLLLDMKTNYDAYKLQERMEEAARAARIENLWKDKKEQEWYYREIYRNLLELKETEAYREYVSLCDVVFGSQETPKNLGTD